MAHTVLLIAIYEGFVLLPVLIGWFVSKAWFFNPPDTVARLVRDLTPPEERSP